MPLHKCSAVILMTLLTTMVPLPIASAAENTPSAGRTAVLIGVPGLAWADLSATKTPHLWRLAGGGSIASLSVRTVGTWTCPMDGWLTVSAGTRAAYPALRCGERPDDPQRRADAGGWYSAIVPKARRLNMASNFRAPVGSLGDAVHRAGGTVMAVGPAAAVAAADSAGRLDAYAPDPSAVTDWSRSSVAIVEADDVVEPYLGSGADPHQVRDVGAAARAAAVARADRRIGGILTALPRDANVIVAGLSDSCDVPHLRVAIGHGPAFTAGHYARSFSARRDGMTILPDITATVLAGAGIDVPTDVLGVPWTTGGPRRTTSATADALIGQDTAAQTLRATLPGFFLVFVGCQLLMYVIAFRMLRGTRGAGRRRIRDVARVFALACAAVPTAAYLVNLLPWWAAGRPGVAMFTGVLAWDAVLVAVALGGPWRRDPMAPGTIIAGITAVTLAADLLLGSPLQQNSLMGYSPLVGGRYYGLGNIAFATFATGMLFLAMGIAHLLLRLDRRAWAGTAVVVLGATAVVFSGSPGLGAKFGGTIALVPGTAVTALIVAGKRVRPPAVPLFAALGVGTIVTICALDYRHPHGRRTHLGRFADQVLHGEAAPVVTRKLLAMLHTVGNIPLTLLVAGGLLLMFFVLIGVKGSPPAPLAEAYRHAPALRAGLVGTLVTSMSGFAVEDSGIAVPAIALTLAVPLAFAAAVHGRPEAGPAMAATGPIDQALRQPPDHSGEGAWGTGVRTGGAAGIRTCSGRGP